MEGRISNERDDAGFRSNPKARVRRARSPPYTNDYLTVKIVHIPDVK